MKLPSPLPFADAEDTAQFFKKVEKIPKSQVNKPGLRTLDGQYKLQWKLLKEMTSTSTHLTADPVLDSWFFVLFSFAAIHSREECKVASLSTLVAYIPTSTTQNISEVLLPAALNNLYCFNYWHLLEFLYFPLNLNENHWILIRVGIENKIIEIFDSLGNELGRKTLQVSYPLFFTLTVY